MEQADISYRSADNADSLSTTVSIYSNRPGICSEWHEDALLAGLHIARISPIDELADTALLPSSDMAIIDCPTAGAAELAALARMDLHFTRSQAKLLVSTSLEALDAVFGCLDNSEVRILVAPSRGDRIIALGQLMADKSSKNVRDLSEDDRLNLLRLTEQVGQLAARLEWLGKGGVSRDGGAFRFESPKDGFENQKGEEDGLVRKSKPALPDPRLVRQILHMRQSRAEFFDAGLFADPAWDMLLDLTAARAEHKRVSVTSLCIASGVPPTTALRWIAQMTEVGLLERQEDDTDRRRVFIALTDHAADLMARYFATLQLGDKLV